MPETVSDAALTASCHCGAARIRLSRKPDYVCQCNCSICTKLNWRCVYFPSDELEIEGEFDAYVRTDLDETFLRVLRCRNCGIPTHWEPLTPPPHERMGVNANLLDPALLEDVPVRYVDGASW